MHDYLINEAIEQIWCNPRQDNQLIIKPARVTRVSGAIKSTKFLDRWIYFPWDNQRAHLFQVGQISPALLGLFESTPSWQKETWYSFDYAMNNLPLFMNIYSELGVNIPRFNAYYMFTREKCLVFAIKEDGRIPCDLGQDNVYFRIYTSAYLKTHAKTSSVPGIELKGWDFVNRNNISFIIDEWKKESSRVGHVEAFVNGNMIDELSLATIKIGDIVEWTYESMVKRVAVWKIKDLKPFTSTLDEKSKYILHYPKSVQVNQIDYVDDIDIYIHQKNKKGIRVGRFYVPNAADAKRNLTHRDYSVVGDYVDFISRHLSSFLGDDIPDILEHEISIKIREGGYNRPLINDSSRIQTLYQLDDTRIMMAMTGVQTQVPVWTASALEQSAYIKLMGLEYKDIDIDITEKAYGYNSMAQLLADTPNFTKSVGGQPVALLGYEAATIGCLVYEYNISGTMLGCSYQDSRDDDYEAKYPQTTMIEAVVGKSSLSTESFYAGNNIVIPPDCSWRLYHCRMDYSHLPPKPFRDWTDITDSDKYKVEDGMIKWVDGSSDQWLCLRTDRNILNYDIQAVQIHGTILFQLFEYADVDGQGSIKIPMEIPCGDLKIYLNGRVLVHGIDYVVNFPYVSINNYQYIVQPAATTAQNIHIRMTGFCSSDLKLNPPQETGFVRNGTISNSKGYQNYHNKILHISVGGAYKDRSQVNFYEDNPEYAPRDRTNGRPYQISEVVTPTRGFTATDTYQLLAIDKAIDKTVDDYMGLYWKPRSNEPVSSSEMRWRLVSPFFSCIVELCASNVWWWYDYEKLTDKQILELCAPYENLLTYDPISEENALPDIYVNITPHRHDQPVTVSRAQYRVLQAVNRLYGNNKVGLNNFITFKIQHERQ